MAQLTDLVRLRDVLYRVLVKTEAAKLVNKLPDNYDVLVLIITELEQEIMRDNQTNN